VSSDIVQKVLALGKNGKTRLKAFEVESLDFRLPVPRDSPFNLHRPSRSRPESKRNIPAKPNPDSESHP